MPDAHGKAHKYLYLVSSVSGSSLQTKVKWSELSCLNYPTWDIPWTNTDLSASLGSGAKRASVLSIYTSLQEPAESIARPKSVPLTLARYRFVYVWLLTKCFIDKPADQVAKGSFILWLSNFYKMAVKIKSTDLWETSASHQSLASHLSFRRKKTCWLNEGCDHFHSYKTRTFVRIPRVPDHLDPISTWIQSAHVIRLQRGNFHKINILNHNLLIPKIWA